MSEKEVVVTGVSLVEEGGKPFKFVNCQECSDITKVDDDASKVSWYCARCTELRALRLEVKQLRSETDWYCTTCRTVYPYSAVDAESDLMNVLRCPSQSCNGILMTRNMYEKREMGTAFG
jgi:hypothetical protein